MTIKIEPICWLSEVHIRRNSNWTIEDGFWTTSTLEETLKEETFRFLQNSVYYRYCMPHIIGSPLPWIMSSWLDKKCCSYHLAHIQQWDTIKFRRSTLTLFSLHLWLCPKTHNWQCHCWKDDHVKEKVPNILAVWRVYTLKSITQTKKHINGSRIFTETFRRKKIDIGNQIT